MKDMTVLGLLITLKSHLVNTVIMHDVSEMEKCKSYEAELLRRFEELEKENEKQKEVIAALIHLSWMA